MPARPSPLPPAPTVRSAMVLVAQARSTLLEARAAADAASRFAAAHLAALRAAAAVVALRTRPLSGRQRPTNAWSLLVTVAPELGDWAAYFAAGARQRAAVEAGAVRAVTDRDADDLLRAAEQFCELTEAIVIAPAPARAS